MPGRAALAAMALALAVAVSSAAPADAGGRSDPRSDRFGLESGQNDGRRHFHHRRGARRARRYGNLEQPRSPLTQPLQFLSGCGPAIGAPCTTSDVVLSNRQGATRSVFSGLVISSGHSFLSQAYLPGAGAIRVSDGPVFGRSCSNTPGCRGIESIETGGTLGGRPSIFIVTFDSGYLPSIDGCVFGRDTVPSGSDTGLSIAGIPVEATLADGTRVDVDPRNRESGYAGDLGRQLAACATPLTSIFRPVGRASGSVFPTLIGAGTLWHPLAGCRVMGNVNRLEDRDITNNATFVSGSGAIGCSTLMRDYVQNFQNDPNSVEMFRSEAAAWSFEMQMYLVATSCNGPPDEVTSGPPECFDPARPYRGNACSFAAPQFCSRVIDFASQPARDDSDHFRARGMRRHHRERGPHQHR